MSTPHSNGVFLTGRVRRGAAKKNKLQIWSGYLINHDNIVRLNEHFFLRLKSANRSLLLLTVARGNSTSSPVSHRNEWEVCQSFVNTHKDETALPASSWWTGNEALMKNISSQLFLMEASLSYNDDIQLPNMCCSSLSFWFTSQGWHWPQKTPCFSSNNDVS